MQQKMDSITFTQERMKRQFDDLQDKTQVDKLTLLCTADYTFMHFQGAPTEIFDMRERMMVISLQK